MLKIKKYWLQACILIVTILVITWTCVLDSKNTPTIQLSKNSWQCTKQKGKIILLNGQPRNTSVCVQYTKVQD